MIMIMSLLISTVIGMGILMIGVHGDRAQTKVMAGVATFWVTVSVLVATTATTFEATLFELPMIAVGVSVVTILLHKLWVEREVKWWKEEGRVK